MRVIKNICYLILSCLVFSGFAADLNIYLKYQEQGLTEQIKEVNQSLSNKGIFKKYNIVPFLENYPLHTTLYLAAFKEAELIALLDRVNNLSQQFSAFEMQLDKLVFTGGNYLMWDVRIDNSGVNQTSIMQLLSDKLVLSLSPYRDQTVSPPPWVKFYPSKLKAFNRYGSPNVFFELSPHFTILATSFTDKGQEKLFQQDMEAWLTGFKASKPTLAVKAVAIGVGYVNQYGQITQEIASFSLNLNSAVKH